MSKKLSDLDPHTALHGLVQECLILLQRPTLTKQEAASDVLAAIVTTMHCLGITPEQIQELWNYSQEIAEVQGND